MSAKYIERPGVLIAGISGKEFKHNGSGADRARAIKELEQHHFAEMDRHGLRVAPRRNEPTPHPETRSTEPTPGRYSSELTRAKTTIVSPQPSPERNPYVGAFERRLARLGRLWGKSSEGQEYKLDMEAKAAEWEAARESKTDAVKFAEAVAPMVQHALKTLSEAEADETVTVAELEQLRSNVELASAGKSDEYKAGDKAWRDTLRAKLEEKAHGHDSIIRQHQAERDRLLQEAWKAGAEPVPQPKSVFTMPRPDQLDRERVAIVDEHGRTKFVRRDEITQ